MKFSEVNQRYKIFTTMKNKISIMLGILVIVFTFLYFSKPEIVKTKTVTKTVIDTVTVIKDNTKPTKIKKVYIKITDTIKEIINDTLTVEKIIYKDKEVNQYKYTDSLENGIVNSVILADKIYKRDITLRTFNKHTTVETTNTIVKSEWYFGSVITLDFNKSIRNASLNAFYTHRNKFLLTGGIGYDVYKVVIPNTQNIVDRNNLTFSLGIAFKF